MIGRLRARFLLAIGVTAMCSIVAAPGCTGRSTTSRAFHCGRGPRPTPPGFPICPSGAFCTTIGAIASADRAREREAGASTDASIGPPAPPDMAPPPFADCPASPKDPSGVVTPYASTTIDEGATRKQRATQATACCYTWNELCPGGRPLVAEDGHAVVAHTREGESAAPWSTHAAVRSGQGSAKRRPARGGARASLVAQWTREAAFEHASIAAFSRAALQLMALGAPADLVARTHAAALDEVDHARRCYAIASRHAGRPLGPGPLPLRALAFEVDAATVACDTLLGGCVHETIASLAADDARLGTDDDDLRAHFATIAADEARHAELAWATLAWLVRAHPRCALPLEAALCDLARELDALSRANASHACAAAPSLRMRVLREIVLPCARALLGGSAFGRIRGAKAERTSRSSSRSRQSRRASAGSPSARGT